PRVLPSLPTRRSSDLKYRTFLFGELGAVDVFSSEILIPLGLSFYVFQFIAYQVDIFRRRIEPTRSLLLLALFILFFPHQVAGPIDRKSTRLNSSHVKI